MSVKPRFKTLGPEHNINLNKNTTGGVIVAGDFNDRAEDWGVLHTNTHERALILELNYYYDMLITSGEM